MWCMSLCDGSTTTCVLEEEKCEIIDQENRGIVISSLSGLGILIDLFTGNILKC